MARIIPSLREKKRYLVFEVISKKKLPYEGIPRAIIGSAKSLIGTLGTAKAGFIMLHDKYNPNLQRGLIRVNNKYIDELRASLCLIDNINNEEVIVRSIGVSGILKKASKYLAS